MKHLTNLRWLSLIAAILFNISLHAQGTVRGMVYDDANGETLPFVSVLIKEVGTGTTTDLDGAFAISLSPGTYSIELSFVGYATQVISDVIVTDDEVNTLNIRLAEQTQQLEEVVISARQLNNTEAAINTIKRKSPNLLDGISRQAFSRNGDNDAAAAISRVTGVSVEGGRYVYVRGLGDRYTKTTLNSMDIPGLDPDRNTIQMDIFPTNLIDNIVVYKTFSPDLPGDFTGGLVNVVTKDFPDRYTIQASGSWSFNPDMNLSNDFPTYEGGGTDFLGIDDGTREIPVPSGPNTRSQFPDPSLDNPLLEQQTRAFTPELGVQNTSSFINQRYAFSLGNQINTSTTNAPTFGYNVSVNYAQSYNLQDDITFADWTRSDDKADNDLVIFRRDRGTIGEEDVLWSALGTLAMKTKTSKVRLSLFHTHNGTKRAGQLLREDFEATNSTVIKNNLEFSERLVTNILLAGKHSFSDNTFELDWALSGTSSVIDEPDIRVAAIAIKPDTSLRAGDGAGIDRLWRRLDEVNANGKIDLTYNTTQWNGLATKFKVGFMQIVKNRTFDIDRYEFRLQRPNDFRLNTDAQQFYDNDYIWTPERGAGLFVFYNYEPTNHFEADMYVSSAYAMTELPLTAQLKSVLGARIEMAKINYSGVIVDPVTNTQVTLDQETILDEVNILPSANFIYALTESENLRFSYSRTLARPSFKEKSNAEIFDLISERTFVGNIDLEQTDIDNLDLRWEKFFQGADLVSVSAYYKSFQNPIELNAFVSPQGVVDPQSFQPVNAPSAIVYGAELEARKNIGFLFPSANFFSHMSLGLNLTITRSEVEIRESELTSRRNEAREAEVVDDTRPLVGQSPFIVNGFMNYNNLNTGLEVNASYNVQGKRLNVVGAGFVPDVYEQPFHSLNVKVSKRFGSDRQWKVSASASNILDDRREWFYEAFGDVTADFRSFSPHRVFGVGLSYILQ